MALIFVLGAVVLLSVLILAFMASASLERVASGSQLNQTEARVLSENVLSLVTAQIRDASTQTNTVWASQPGLIRTYSSSGNITYKLYSAQQMVATNFNPSANVDISTTWATVPDQFVDLNSPVRVTSGNATITNYPILDPGLAWNGTNGIKGFSNNSSNAAMVATGSNANPIPMPVRWLYVLQDGALQAMDSSGKVTSATTNNPIVGRVAFWTDDESCKININTASQGTFWDVPRGKGNNFEKGSFTTTNSFIINKTGLGVGQPIQGEFQRYPGHPATTSLGVVLDATDPATGNFLFWPYVTDTTQRRELIYQLIPRVNAGGSKGGTFCPPPIGTGSSSKLLPDGDRLYASVDELAFSGAFTGTSRTNNTSSTDTNSGLSINTIQRMNFFLTANSRAPEVTLFNTPRMTIWPVDVNTNNRSFLDRTIAFCSTLKNTSNATTEFLFTRNSLNPAELQAVNSGNSTTITSGALSPTNDFGANNQRLYSYLQRLTSQSIPGFGSSTFATKLGVDRDQVLTEIFDYIRCINLFDKTTTNSTPFTARPWIATSANSWNTNTYNTAATRPTNFGSGNGAQYSESLYFGQVVPLQINSNSTRGFGRFATVVGAALVFFGREPCVATNKYIDGNRTNTTISNFNHWKQTNTASTGQSLDSFTNNPILCVPASEMQAMLLLTYATPSAGTIDYHHRCDYTITGLQNFEINGTNAGFPANATEKRMLRGRRGDTVNLAGGAPDWWGLNYTKNESLGYASAAKSGETSAAGDAYYPFISAPIAINTATNTPVTNALGIDTGTFSFKGGEITIKASVGTNVVQTTSISFPDFSAPNPQWQNVKSATNSIYCYDRPHARAVAAMGGNEVWPALIMNKLNCDVVRMMELKGGDIRMVAGRETVSKDFFVKATNYDISTAYQAHSLWRHPLASFGSLVVTSTTINNLYNGTPSNLNGVTGAGDWDISTPVNAAGSGLAYTICGGFINKADDSGSGYLDNYGRSSAPYFDQVCSIVSSDLYFSPNRMIPSAVMFGSLSTGVKRHDPASSPGSTGDLSWQTLLFRPNGQTADTHPGSASPPDHLLLDLFTMPVVEPYPISEPFSTAGKININYQIAPFTYITRDTGMRAALDALRITAVPTSNAYLQNFGPDGSDSNNAAMNYRYPIDVDATLTLFADRFTAANNNPFKSATEICDMFLVPKPETVTASGVIPATKTPYTTTIGSTAPLTYTTNFWQSASGGAGTADNLRERPYAALYPRLTTKSNTYTVHLRVQSLKKRPGSDPQTFDQTRDVVTSEYRGSFMIERFLESSASNFDITATSGTNSILGPYRFRVVNTKQFSP